MRDIIKSVSIVSLLFCSQLIAANEIHQRYVTGESNLYAVIEQPTTLKVWDGDSFETSPTWGDCDIALTEHSLILGLYTASIPATIPAGAYYIYIYQGASPANTDTYIGGDIYHWDGAAEINWVDMDTIAQAWLDGGRLDLLLDGVFKDSDKPTNFGSLKIDTGGRVDFAGRRF